MLRASLRLMYRVLTKAGPSLLASEVVAKPLELRPVRLHLQVQPSFVRQLVGLVLGFGIPDDYLRQSHVPPWLLCPSPCPTLARITVDFVSLSWTLKSPEALLEKGLLSGWMSSDYVVTERVGFEPTVSCPTQHFQCCAFDHSAISPVHLCNYFSAAPKSELSNSSKETPRPLKLAAVPASESSARD